MTDGAIKALLDGWIASAAGQKVLDGYGICPVETAVGITEDVNTVVTSTVSGEMGDGHFPEDSGSCGDVVADKNLKKTSDITFSAEALHRNSLSIVGSYTYSANTKRQSRTSKYASNTGSAYTGSGIDDIVSLIVHGYKIPESKMRPFGVWHIAGGAEGSARVTAPRKRDGSSAVAKAAAEMEAKYKKYNLIVKLPGEWGG